MKGKIIFPIILSAMLLTACGEQEQPQSEVQTERTETTFQAVTAASETELIEVPETAAVTAYEVTEETAETAAAAETLPPIIENISENVTLDIQKIDLNEISEENINANRLFFIGDTAAVGPWNGDREIYFLDLDGKTLKGKISPPEDWKFVWLYTYIKGSGDALCKLEVYQYDAETDENKYGALVVYNDFSTEVIADEPEKNLAIPVGGHNVSDVYYNLYDADSGEILAEGFNDKAGYGISSKWFDYQFPIDDDRFVYRTCGYECMPGFGYYDFTAGKAVDFPESRDFIPVGCHNGKIYAELTAWDGMCGGELRTFDIDTLESKIFMPQNQTSGKFTEYTMSPDGGFIIANDFDGSGMNILRIISPDSGENLVKCELNFGGSYGSEFTFIDGSRFATYVGGEIIIFDVKM